MNVESDIPSYLQRRLLTLYASQSTTIYISALNSSKNASYHLGPAVAKADYCKTCAILPTSISNLHHGSQLAKPFTSENLDLLDFIRRTKIHQKNLQAKICKSF